MSDNREMHGQQDRTRINVNEDYELRYWTERFNITAEELRKAVDSVGVMAADVEQYLQGNRA